MRVVIRPIKPDYNHAMYYREFDSVSSITSTMSGNYILNHRDGNVRVEFHLPDDCYLLTMLDDDDKVSDIDMV